MFKKNLLPVFIVIFTSLELCAQESQGNNNFRISEALRIIQKGELIYSPDNVSDVIYNEPFEIQVYGAGDFEVFISVNTLKFTIFENLTLPVDYQIIFMPGYGYAQEIDLYYLFVNGHYDYGFNYFDISRRVKEKTYDNMLIDGFILAEKNREWQELQEIFFTIYIDHNQNNLIEENEIIHFSLKVRN